MSAISEAFAAVLRGAREEFNAAFMHAKRESAGLDGAAFSGLLVRCVDPLAAAVHALEPEKTGDCVRAAYAVALELAVQRVTARAGSGSVEECFGKLLPQLASLVAREPEMVIGPLINAAYNLDAAGARTQDWLTLMAALGPRCASAAQLLELGQVAAWRCGLAHYREQALVLADRLPVELTCSLLGAPAGTDWPELRGALARDPWHVPGQPHDGLRVATVVGAFRGFGGAFTEPPQVRTLGSNFVVLCKDLAWLLIADAFGASLLRASREEHAQAKALELPHWIALEKHTLHTPEAELALPLAGELTSAALNDSATTLAITSAYTHGVVLVALGAGE